MKFKFFFVSLTALLLGVSSSMFIQYSFFQSERLTLLDDQIRQTATSIIDSELSDLKTYDHQKADAIISEELGPDRVGKFFIIRNQHESVLFQTQNIKLLDLSVPRAPTWVTIQNEKVLIRALNLELPRFPDRTLQVGIITDPSFMNWTVLNPRSLFIVAVILLLIIAITWVLSSLLLAPIKKMALYMREISYSLDKNSPLPTPPGTVSKNMYNSFLYKNDEFRHLAETIQTLTQRINRNTKFTKSWTAQMAHELKTPLTIMYRDIEIQCARDPEFANHSAEILANITKISSTITNFLNWAEIASYPIAYNLHVVHMHDILTLHMPQWQKIAQTRVCLSEQRDFRILCNPFHLEQLLDNLVQNSIKYSQERIEINYAKNILSVRDWGGGIPQEVLERIGSPFNKGLNKKTNLIVNGSGLGLAWCKTICDMYSWALQIESNSRGTLVKITFPPIILE